MPFLPPNKTLKAIFTTSTMTSVTLGSVADGIQTHDLLIASLLHNHSATKPHQCNLGKLFTHTCASVTKQYNLVPVMLGG